MTKTATKRTPPVPGLHPSIVLGDGQWERVIDALTRRGTKQDAALAERIAKSVEATRERARARDGGGEDGVR